jgi:hypothetical protein
MNLRPSPFALYPPCALYVCLLRVEQEGGGGTGEGVGGARTAAFR